MQCADVIDGSDHVVDCPKAMRLDAPLALGLALSVKQHKTMCQPLSSATKYNSPTICTSELVNYRSFDSGNHHTIF
jgi:hypothetical protein